MCIDMNISLLSVFDYLYSFCFLSEWLSKDGSVAFQSFGCFLKLVFRSSLQSYLSFSLYSKVRIKIGEP